MVGRCGLEPLPERSDLQSDCRIRTALPTQRLVEHEGIEPSLPPCKGRVKTHLMPHSGVKMAIHREIESLSLGRQPSRLTRCVMDHLFSALRMSSLDYQRLSLQGNMPWWTIWGSNPGPSA